MTLLLRSMQKQIFLRPDQARRRRLLLLVADRARQQVWGLVLRLRLRFRRARGHVQEGQTQARLTYMQNMKGLDGIRPSGGLI